TIGTCTNGTFSAGNLTVAAATTATCTYSAAPTDRTATLNTATATLNGQSYTGTAAVAWTGNTIGHNPVTVTDSYAGTLGTADADVQSVWTFTYPRTISTVGLACGSYTYPNTAQITETGQSASQTVTVIVQGCAKIMPTNTTCQDYLNGAPSLVGGIQYSVKNGVINQVNPGVFFYFNAVNAVAGTNTFTIHQSITPGSFTAYLPFAAGSNVYLASTCTSLSGVTITQSGADTVVTFTAPSTGSYVFGIKYSASFLSQTKVTPPIGGTATYDYSMYNGGLPLSGSPIDGSDASVDLTPK
ncbi:MAG TPA: hypothetical protein VFG00_04890, partial [Acidothermaceae bacterium]|nr:hypothetical protein [Acidothermaceae bacterium]